MAIFTFYTRGHIAVCDNVIEHGIKGIARRVIARPPEGAGDWLASFTEHAFDGLGWYKLPSTIVVSPSRGLAISRLCCALPHKQKGRPFGRPFLIL